MQEWGQRAITTPRSFAMSVSSLDWNAGFGIPGTAGLSRNGPKDASCLSDGCLHSRYSRSFHPGQGASDRDVTPGNRPRHQAGGNWSAGATMTAGQFTLRTLSSPTAEFFVPSATSRSSKTFPDRFMRSCRSYRPSMNLYRLHRMSIGLRNASPRLSGSQFSATMRRCPVSVKSVDASLASDSSSDDWLTQVRGAVSVRRGIESLRPS